MKRTFCIGLALVMVLGFSACVSSAKTAPDNQEESSTQSKVVVDENIITVDVTLPATFFEGKDMSTFDADAYTQEQGFKKAVLNDDGSVTVTMTKAKHWEMLEEISNQCDTSFAEMVESENTPYIKNITHSENFNTVTVDVDRAAYEAATFEMTPFTLGLSGMMYQVFSGDDQHVEVTIKDVDTGDVINNIIYPDAMNQDSKAAESNF